MLFFPNWKTYSGKRNPEDWLTSKWSNKDCLRPCLMKDNCPFFKKLIETVKIKCSWRIHGLLGFLQLKGCSMIATTLLQTTSQQVIPTPPGKEGETTIEVVGSITLRNLCSWKQPWKCKKWNSEFMRPAGTKLFIYQREIQEMGDKSVLVPKKIWIVLGKEHQIHKSELKCGECTPQLKPSAVDPRENIWSLRLGKPLNAMFEHKFRIWER